MSPPASSMMSSRCSSSCWSGSVPPGSRTAARKRRDEHASGSPGTGAQPLTDTGHVCSPIQTSLPLSVLSLSLSLFSPRLPRSRVLSLWVCGLKRYEPERQPVTRYFLTVRKPAEQPSALFEQGRPCAQATSPTLFTLSDGVDNCPASRRIHVASWPPAFCRVDTPLDVARPMGQGPADLEED